MPVGKNRKWQGLKWFSLVVPALVFYLAFFVWPAISSAYYSVTDWNGLTANYIGFYNYEKIFSDNRILLALKNTLFYAVAITFIQNIIGIALALFLNRSFKTVNVLRTLYFMPAIFSILVIGYVWKFILEPNSGALNGILEALNLKGLQQDWLGDPSYSKWMIIIVSIWQYLGYNMVIYVAGLQSIPKELLEAGEIDGCGNWAKFRNITFPLLAPSITINLLLNTIGTLKIFDQIFAMTNGGPGHATESIATMIYQLGFGPNSDWGYGTALSILLFIGVLLITGIQVTYLRRREVDM